MWSGCDETVLQDPYCFLFRAMEKKPPLLNRNHHERQWNCTDLSTVWQGGGFRREPSKHRHKGQCMETELPLVGHHNQSYSAGKQRKGKSPNTKAVETKSNQNHSNGTTAPSRTILPSTWAITKHIWNHAGRKLSIVNVLTAMAKLLQIWLSTTH
jgi:hypothetical protein